jgi:hypothetical protein
VATQKEVAPKSVLSDVLLEWANEAIPILESLPLEIKRKNHALTGHYIMVVKKSITTMRSALSEIQLEDRPESRT